MTIDNREIRWAFDFVQSAVCGSSLLIETKAEENAEPGTTLFVASAATPDRAMDVVAQNWKLANFRANPVILDNHDHRRVVGHSPKGGASVPKTGDDAGKLMIRVKWDMDSPDPTIRNVGHQHMSGIRNAGSVGFRHGKRTRRDKLAPDHEFYQEPVELSDEWGTFRHSGYLFEGNELLEFSSATIPMHAQALQKAFRMMRRAEGDPGADPADDPPPDVPEFLTLLEDAAVRGQLLDLVWPDAIVRFVEMLSPPPPDDDTPADDAPAKAAQEWLRRQLRSDATIRRIVAAYPNAGPPPASTPEPIPFASRVARLLEL